MEFLNTFATFLADEAQSNLNQPLSLEAIQNYEKSLGEQERIKGFKFPPSYRAFLLRYNGGYAEWDAEEDGPAAEWDGGPMEEGGSEEGTLEYSNSANEDEREDGDDGSAYIRFFQVGEEGAKGMSLETWNGAETVLMNHEIETYFPFEPLVMFASDEGGNFWAFDPRHTRADGEMPVRFCDHETGDIYAQAEDFPSFILAFVNHKLRYRGIENPL